MDGSWTGVILVALAILIWVAAATLKRWRRKRALAARYLELMLKYSNQQVVQAIMEAKVWQGMSQDQLVDSRGPPHDKEEVVYKSKVKQTWKYGPTGKNRFRERIFLENGAVVGWRG